MDLHEIMIWKSKKKKVIVVFHRVLTMWKTEILLPVELETAGSWDLEQVGCGNKTREPTSLLIFFVDVYTKIDCLIPGVFH